MADFYAGIVMEAGPKIYQFDDVRVDLKNFKVYKAGLAVHLEPKAIKALIFLIERRGRLIEKRELLDAVWQDAFVTENAMTKVIAKLRKTLGEGIKEAKYIETVPTRGYRFIAEVESKASLEIEKQPEPGMPARFHGESSPGKIIDEEGATSMQGRDKAAPLPTV